MMKYIQNNLLFFVSKHLLTNTHYTARLSSV